MTYKRPFIDVSTVGSLADNICSTANQYDRIYTSNTKLQKRLGQYTNTIGCQQTVMLIVCLELPQQLNLLHPNYITILPQHFKS